MISISIAMATYNGARFLREQLDSLARQEVLPLELVVGDDGSSDETLAVLAEFAATSPFPVHVIRNPANLGYGENFLQTAARCRGEWIAFCDQDDRWAPSKLRVVSQAIADGPSDLMLVAHDAEVVNNGGAILRPRLYGFDDRLHRGGSLPGDWLCAGFLQTFRADLIRAFPLEQRLRANFLPDPDAPKLDPYPHDGWIAWLANAAGSVQLLGAALVHYRRHGTNTTSLGKQSTAEAVSLALGNHAARYSEVSRWHSDWAAELTGFTANPAAAPYAAALRESAARNRREAAVLAERASLYAEPARGRRLRHLGGLVSSGAYGWAWSLSYRSLIKDAVRAVA